MSKTYVCDFKDMCYNEAISDVEEHMRKGYLSWLPAILIMLIIFYFSSKPASVSGESSLRITEYIMKLYENIADKQVAEEQRADWLLLLEHYIRKLAHLTEYGLLAAAICLPLHDRRLRGRRLWLWSVLLSAAYAATDELHQRFVPGRSGELKDVLIDTIGAALGALTFVLIAKAAEQIRKGRREVKSQ
jgi:VanZ family protein